MRTRLLARCFAAIAALLAVPATDAGAQRVEKPALTIEGAKKAAADARQHGKGAAITIVDDGGNLIYLERLDDTFAAARISIGKARTAASFSKPTGAFEEIIRNRRTPMVALEDFTPLQGGVPIEAGGRVVGGIGVSGAASQQRDEEVAKAGAAALRSGETMRLGIGSCALLLAAMPAPGTDVTYVPAAMVSAAFEPARSSTTARGRTTWSTPAAATPRGRPRCICGTRPSSTCLRARRRSWPAARSSTRRRSRPTRCAGPLSSTGESRRLGKGDVVIVPSGTPHWFKEVDGPVLYWVVKVR